MWTVIVRYGAQETALGPFKDYAMAHRYYMRAREKGYTRTVMHTFAPSSSAIMRELCPECNPANDN